MAEQTEESAPETSTEKKKNGTPILYVMSVIPVITVLSVLLVTKVINPRFAPPADASVESVDEEKDDKAEDEKETYICELGTVLANPLGSRGLRIMKVGVSLEVTSKSVLGKVEKYKPKLQHQLIMVLSSKKLDVVSSPEGKTSLQSELRDAFTSVLGLEPGEIQQVYFGEFVIQ